MQCDLRFGCRVFFLRIGLLSTTIQPKWLHTYILIKVDLTNATSCEDSKHSSTIIVCFLTAAIHVVKRATHQNLHVHTSNYESKFEEKKHSNQLKIEWCIKWYHILSECIYLLKLYWILVVVLLNWLKFREWHWIHDRFDEEWQVENSIHVHVRHLRNCQFTWYIFPFRLKKWIFSLNYHYQMHKPINFPVCISFSRATHASTHNIAYSKQQKRLKNAFRKKKTDVERKREKRAERM